MEFPETVEEFMEQYKVVDTEEVYSNGVEFVPIFRMKQWFEHEQNKVTSMEDQSMSEKQCHHYVDSHSCYWCVFKNTENCPKQE
jgi:hypothetical protein